MKKENVIEELIVELKDSVEHKDNEKAHVVYDQVLREIAKEHEPAILKDITKIVEGTQFWWA